MKYGQIRSGDMKTGKGPSGNKDNNNNNKNKNLEQNRDKIGLRGSRSETDSNNNGNIIKKDSFVFLNEDSPTKKDNPPDADNNQYDKFNASQSKMNQQKEVDELDLQLLNLLLKGFDNKRIADTTESPLSTIQRRTRLIFERGLATSKVEPDYKRLGFKKGLLAIRLKGGKIQPIVKRLQRIRGIIAISANIGAFPLTCTIVYKNASELWNMISNVQELDNIQEVLWSEEIYNFVSIENLSGMRHD
jgi:DNA-binding Lrp family transcriptional regulator